MIEYAEPSKLLDIEAARAFLLSLETEQQSSGDEWSGNRFAAKLGVSHARVHQRITRLRRFGVLHPEGKSRFGAAKYRVDWNRFEQIASRKTS